MIEPVTPTAPRPVRHPILTQWWKHLTFLHWEVRESAIAHLFPPGTRPDTVDGRTYVGLIPFQMDKVAGLPYLGHFCETNVRLYSVDNEGRRGVIFLSLDATRLIPVLTGQLAVSLPYIWSAMTLTRSDSTISYVCRRRGTGLTSQIEIDIGDPLSAPTELEHFLTARWGLHTRWYGHTVYLPNDHPQWPLRRAKLTYAEDSLLNATGLPVAGPPMSVLHSPGVPVRFGPPQKCSSSK